jgi:hypothetical protein
MATMSLSWNCDSGRHWPLTSSRLSLLNIDQFGQRKPVTRSALFNHCWHDFWYLSVDHEAQALPVRRSIVSGSSEFNLLNRLRQGWPPVWVATWQLRVSGSILCSISQSLSHLLSDNLGFPAAGEVRSRRLHSRWLHSGRCWMKSSTPLSEVGRKQPPIQLAVCWDIIPFATRRFPSPGRTPAAPSHGLRPSDWVAQQLEYRWPLPGVCCHHRSRMSLYNDK